MSNLPLNRTVVVRNAQGLHARPADALVRAASQFESTIVIGKDGELADCSSILSLLTLGAAQGTELSISAEGADANKALKAICELFDSGFEESTQLDDAKPAVDS